jgi:hypothetical protein
VRADEIKRWKQIDLLSALPKTSAGVTTTNFFYEQKSKLIRDIQNNDLTTLMSQNMI